MPQPSATPGTTNGDPLDRFTLVHGSIGVAYGLLGVPGPWVLGLAIGWELFERPLKDGLPGLFPHASQDSVANATLDAAAVVLGWWLTKKLKEA